jgi:thymidylate synthase ThyX
MTSKELSKWSDSFMFKAEESLAAEGPKVYLLGGPSDPLGQIAACVKMYKGEVVRDLRDVTDAERRYALEQVQKTILAMPLEAVQLHFMVEGVTRPFANQMVRQRTGAYAQESMRFAVKEDAATAVALPPSLDGTKTLDEMVELDLLRRAEIGFQMKPEDEAWMKDLRYGIRDEILGGKHGEAQANRLIWDEEVKQNAEAYLRLINNGMPAEDARGVIVHNITTRLNYITNLRSWYDTMAVRVSDQAQFEWRAVAMHMALALRQFGARTTYEVYMQHKDIMTLVAETDEAPSWTILERDGSGAPTLCLVRRSSEWQYVALSNELKPIEFKKGSRAFGADFDRPSRIGERVDAFAKHGVPSSEWTKGSEEFGIPPINPEEWLLDPNSARLANGMEFDIFGNRVPVGTGWHYMGDGIIVRNTNSNQTDGYDVARWPRDFDENGYTDANKPGVSKEQFEAAVKAASKPAKRSDS